MIRYSYILLLSIITTFLPACHDSRINEQVNLELIKSTEIIRESCIGVMRQFNKMMNDDTARTGRFYYAACRVESLTTDIIYMDTTSSAYIVTMYDSLIKTILAIPEVDSNFVKLFNAKQLIGIDENISYVAAKARVFRLEYETISLLIRKVYGDCGFTPMVFDACIVSVRDSSIVTIYTSNLFDFSNTEIVTLTDTSGHPIKQRFTYSEQKHFFVITSERLPKGTIFVTGRAKGKKYVDWEYDWIASGYCD